MEAGGVGDESPGAIPGLVQLVSDTERLLVIEDMRRIVEHSYRAVLASEAETAVALGDVKRRRETHERFIALLDKLADEASGKKLPAGVTP
jgi:hypothetical protein